MNKKALYETIMKSVSKQVKHTLNEWGDRLPIGFYTKEEREQQKKELEQKKQNQNDDIPAEMEQMKQLKNIQKNVMLQQAPFSIALDEINATIKFRLENDENIAINFIEDEDKWIILCYSLNDYIEILKMIDGRYDIISARTVAYSK